LTRGRRATRRANQQKRAAVPAVMQPRVEWDEPDPIATQPLPPAEPGTDLMPANELEPELAAAVAKIPVCSHCGGRHVRACPRVKEMRFHPNGNLAAVMFWRDDQWSTGMVFFEDEINPTS
jgi:hypothetical protein